MLEKKAEQMAELEREVGRLRSELSRKTQEKSMKVMGVEVERTLSSSSSSSASVAPVIPAPTSSIDEKSIAAEKSAAAAKMWEGKAKKLEAEVVKLKRAKDAEEQEKDQLAEEKICISKALMAAQRQIEAMEEALQESRDRSESDERAAPIDAGTNTEDFRHKLKGLAYYVYCLRCAAKHETNEEAPDSDIDAAKMRLLLMQDMKNQETLFQINRERNLLRDVMKIMYSRQWFSDEGKPHVRRALRRVGIDVLI